MNEEIRDKWTTALKSGEYEQSRGHLKTFLGYCCLGVLCDIIKDDVNGRWAMEKSAPTIARDTLVYKFEISGSETFDMYSLSELVREYVELYYIPRNEEHISKLIYMNDEGRTFGEIADFIEAEL